MEEKQNMSRRDVLKWMGASTLALATVTEAIQHGDKSCVYRIGLL